MLSPETDQLLPIVESCLCTLSLAIGQCEVEDSNKVECGYYGITRKQCEDVCCCWQESNVPGVPFCYQKVGESEESRTAWP